MRILLLLLAVVLACAVLYAVRPARAQIETVTVIDDPAAGTTTLSTRDFNLLVHYYNLMLEERAQPRRATECI